MRSEKRGVLADERVSLYNVSTMKEGRTMANQHQLDLLRQGVDAWNAWRTQHAEVQLDLSGANLSRANLIGVYLDYAQLSRANLIGADLSGAHFSYAELIGAELIGANLSRSNLGRADFSYTHLSGANLDGAALSGADFSKADLSNANLSGADLGETNLSGAHLSKADLSKARMGGTTLGNVDLRTVKGLETIVHIGPSTIGTDTISRSEGDIPDIFLRGVGLSDTFITYTRSLAQNPIEYYTCFISYSSKDQEFAERLYTDLQSKGVRCWYASEDMEIGDKIRPRIDETIRLYDKLLVVLSEHSIASSWVAYEVEKALNKEPEGTPNVLFPIRLDQTLLTCPTPWAEDIRRTRHIGDFERWKEHDTYQKSLQRLLRALNSSKPR
jgi:hypothetical protein